MSVLSDAVEARYSAQYLTSITNPQNADNVVVSSTTIGLAADDAEQDFPIYAGVDFDEADPLHINIGVEGVIAKLVMRTAQSGPVLSEMHDRWIERLKALARIAGRDRIMPKSKSELEPSREKQDGETARPDFDSNRWGGIRLNNPSARQDRRQD